MNIKIEENLEKGGSLQKEREILGQEGRIQKETPWKGDQERKEQYIKDGRKEKEIS